MKKLLLVLLLGWNSWAEASKTYVQTPVAAVRKTPDDKSEQVTQALIGDEVQVLEQRKGWVKIFVKPQYRTEKGYPGWVHTQDLSTQPPPAEQPPVVVSSPEVWLRAKADPKAEILVRAPLGAQLVPVGPWPSQGWGCLWVPGLEEPVYAPVKHFSPAPPAPTSDGQKIVDTAWQLKGTRYLWGGMSNKGIDCSGFTYTAYRVHGILIPRDADQQFLVGDPVKLADLQPGDLMFFGDTAEEISHVGMYAGDGKFIHSSGSLGGVTITKIDHPKYTAIYQGARRILGSSKTLP